MATDAADDDKKSNAAMTGDEQTPRVAVPEGDAASAAREGQRSAPILDEGAPPKPKTVWTASDARGPLERAGSETAAEPLGDLPEPGNEPAEAMGTRPPDDPRAGAAPAGGPTGRRTSSVVPIAAGLVIGAIIGAGSAGLVYSMMGAGTPAPDPQVASLASRVAALEQKPDPTTAVSALQRQVADLQSKRAAVAEPAPTATAPAAVDLGPLQQKVADLQNSLDALKTQSADSKDVQAKVASLETEIATLKTGLAGATSDLSAMKTGFSGLTDSQKSIADRAMMPALAVVADSLVQQIDLGHPYQEQVNALVALGADPAQIAILRQNADKGVPSAKTLAAKFEPLAEPISATAHKAPPNAGFLDRLKSGMFSMVSIRNADDTSGPDLPSRVARIRTDLAHDDIADALSTWDALPADAKTKSDVKEKGEIWSALARASADAMTAARALQHQAIAALGTKRS